jgi:hypothetical protein
MTQDPQGVPNPPRSPLFLYRDDASDATHASAELLQRTCNRVTGNLRDMLGVDGCAALLTRCLARTDQQHPALATVWRQDGREIHLDGVADAVEKHGEAAVTAGIEALMTALLDLLGRFIGADMAIRIIDLGAPTDERRPGAT